MKKEEGEKDIVGDSETNAAASDNSIVEEVNEVPLENEDFEVPTENVSKKRHGSTSHAIDIAESETSSTKSSTENDSCCLQIRTRQRMSSLPRPMPVVSAAATTKKVSAAAITEKVNIDILEKQHSPITQAINVAQLETSTENGARDSYIWEKNDSKGDNSTLVLELKSYEKSYIKRKQKILKVPTMLPRGSHSDYDPKIVAIGPYHNPRYHNGDPKLKQMEAIKIQFTLQYADQSGKSIEKLYEEMEELLIDAKNYYAEDVVKDFNNKEFVDMMFLDSCFVIQFMYICLEPAENAIGTTYIETSLIMRDIMLLENQLPFKILIKLMRLSSRFEKGIREKMIENFIKQIMNDPHIEEKAPKRKTCFWFCQTNSESEGSSKKKKEPIHLLELIQTKFVDGEEINKGASKKSSSHWCSYRTVKELESVGVHFQPSKSRQFSNITFNSMLLYGRLNLPQITIEDNTQSLLLNLVAFETSLDAQRNFGVDIEGNFGVSSYVYFMDTLIDHAKDVKELRSKGIILNLLGTDQQVADLFNEISENLVPDVQVFGSVKNSLNDFYRSNPRLWVTEFLHNHFRSPWAIIAFFAAIVVLGLTITQTVFSAIQL